MYDVVLFLEHPHATGKTSVVESVDVLEVVETNRPKSCKQKENIINYVYVPYYRLV